MNFADMIFHHALTRPEKPAVILADRVVTYGMMAQGILSVEDRLRILGLKPGDLVAVAIEPPIRHLIAAAALFRLNHPSLSAQRTSDIPAMGLPIAVFLEGAHEAMVPGLNQILVEEDWFTDPPRCFDATPSRGFPDGDAICRVSFSSGRREGRKHFLQASMSGTAYISSNTSQSDKFFGIGCCVFPLYQTVGGSRSLSTRFMPAKRFASRHLRATRWE